MPRLESTSYTLGFAAAVCVVCALLVSVAAVGLSERQENNARLYRQKNVLLAAGLVKPGEDLSAAELLKIFDANIETRLIDLSTGAPVPPGKLDPKTYDQRRARTDPTLSRAAPANNARPRAAAQCRHRVLRDGQGKGCAGRAADRGRGHVGHAVRLHLDGP